MKYYFKILLLSVGIGCVNLFIFFSLLQFQIVHNSSYVPKEFFPFILILIAVPIQFLILLLVAHLSKRNEPALIITSFLFIVTCTLLLWFTSAEERATYNNEQVYNTTEKYDYQQGISTPEGYPVKLLSNSGFGISVKGDRNPVTLLETNKVYSINWGNGDTTFKSSMDGGVAVPDALSLYWYSYLEDKYYGLNTQLDRDKISENFKNGFKRDIKGTLTSSDAINAKYNSLIAGIAPGGDVVLWISGGSDTKELEVFKAKELNRSQLKDYDIVTEDDRQKVLKDTCTCEDRPQFRKIVHNDQPIPFGIWSHKYRKKFNWKVSINNFGQSKSALNFYYFNGERNTMFNEDLINLKFQERVLPDFIKFVFIKDQKKYKAFIEFEEDELFNAFEKLTENNPNEPVEIVLNINSNLKQAKIQLKSKEQTLDLKNLQNVKVSLN